MAKSIELKDFTIEDVTTPKEGYIVYLDRYWACIDGDPTKALFYGKYHSPQCNGNKHLCEHLNYSLHKEDSRVQTVFIPIAYIKRVHYN